MRPYLMSGYCANPSAGAHERCERNGAGNTANPAGEFQPCPCACHLGETFECGGCGRDIREAPNMGLDEDGDNIYTHLDKSNGRAIGEDCP